MLTIQPDNFLYFITLFTISIFGGTYLLFANYLNRLLVINVAVFFLTAIRVATEYYLPQVATFEDASQLAAWHGVPVNLLAPLQWAMIWFYVRPLQGWRFERVANQLYLWLGLIIPFIGHHYYCTVDRKIFYFHPEQIDGYWMFQMDFDFWYSSWYQNHIDLSILLIIIVLIVGIIRTPRRRVRQSFLLVSFVILPVIYLNLLKADDWQIPAMGGLHVLHTLIISWYVSNYRLFRNNLSLLTKDLFDSVSDLVISTDTKLRITSFNAKAASFFAAQHKDIFRLFSQTLASEQEDFERQLNQLLQQEVEELEVELNGSENEVRTFSLKVAPFKNDEQLIGYTFLLTDLTDIRAQEQQLTELNATKDRLFAIIGHDLRKPALTFRGIGRKVNYLLQKEDYKTLLALGSSLEKAALSLNSLLDNLLSWALQQRGVLPYRPQYIPLTETIEAIEDHFRIFAANKSIDLTFDFSNDAQVFADPNALTTIVRNLVDNAIKFTPENGKVRVNEEIMGDQIMLKFTDTGIGIEPEDLPKLFRLGGTKSREGTAGEKGTGLGMNLVNELVKLNNGRIEIDSQPQQGTVIKVILPMRATN